jgi:hypothetical protein
MPRPSRLLRFLLIAALCLNGAMSLWVSTAMAAGLVQQIAGSQGPASTADTGACDDEATSLPAPAGQDGHDDCDCSQSGCNCQCLSPAAAIAYGVPFLGGHVPAGEPLTSPPTFVPLSALTPVFRPPIG